MAYSDKIKATVNGVTLTASCFKLNLLFYKEIGGRVYIHGLSSSWEDKPVDVYLTNWYFVNDPSWKGGPAPQIPIGPPVERAFHNKRWNTHRHFAVGIGVKVTATVSVPTLGPVGLPLVGVISRAVVHVGSQNKTFITQKGSVPSNFPV